MKLINLGKAHTYQHPEFTTNSFTNKTAPNFTTAGVDPINYFFFGFYSSALS